MHIEQRGSGPHLVMLHGWSMHSAVWHQLAERLAERFTLHLIDLPGHGQSDWQSGAFQFDKLLPELAAQTPQQAIWIGWSLGGLIALGYVQRYPHRVDKLSLIASTPRFVQEDDWPCAMPASTFEAFADNLAVDQQQTLQRFLLLQAKGAEQSRETIRELSQQLASQHMPEPEALIAGLDCLLNADMRDALSNLSCPLQLILGNRDTLIPVSLIEHVQLLNPAIQVAVLDGAGHAPFIAQPTRCDALLEQFING